MDTSSHIHVLQKLSFKVKLSVIREIHNPILFLAQSPLPTPRFKIQNRSNLKWYNICLNKTVFWLV